MFGRTRLVIIAAISLIIGIAWPYIELAFKCRSPHSEACVWAKSFWSLSIWVEPPIVAVVAAVILSAATAVAWRR